MQKFVFKQSSEFKLKSKNQANLCDHLRHVVVTYGNLSYL